MGPFLKPTAALRRKLSIAGVSLAAFVLLGHFLSVCIAISVKMQDSYSLNGAGFVFLVMAPFFVILAHQLVICTLTLWSAFTTSAETGSVEAQKPQSPALPTLVGQRQSVVAWEKDAPAKKVDAADNC